MSKYNIPDSLYTLDLDNRLYPLNEDQNRIFLKAKKILDTQIEKDKAFIVYRGESKNKLEDILNVTD